MQMEAKMKENELNSNIRCIEMKTGCRPVLTARGLNSNIRCIEMLM